MANSAAITDVECSVCHEDFREPKILPCTHLVCKACLLNWLSKAGPEGGCPLCRAPVVSATAGDDEDVEGDLEAEVDALPTNLAVMSLVESRQVLHSPHVCKVCDEVSATSYCMQCDAKLCHTCVKSHKKFPAMKNHVIEDLGNLTVERLAETNRATCQLHPDRPAELFCSAHQKLICLLCGTTTHEGCSGKKMVDDAADEKREELRQRANDMRRKEQTLHRQIEDAKDMFKAMRRTAKATFDDFAQLLEKRRLRVERDIQKQEDVTMTSLKDLETSRAALASNAATVEGVVGSSSGSAVLGMVGRLWTKLDAVDKQHGGHRHVDTVQFIIDDNQLQRLKVDLSALGKIINNPKTAASSSQSVVTSNTTAVFSQSVVTPKTTAESSLSDATPKVAAASSFSDVTPQAPRRNIRSSQSVVERDKSRREDLAHVIKEGDRVKRGLGWDLELYGNQDGGGLGTVIKLDHYPAGLFVVVRWDNGQTYGYCMGYGGHYDLDLA